jgi:glycosyltransferase involved in cell wall biosynthesis
VTSHDDRRTSELFFETGVRGLVTYDMYRDGRRFSLGAAINAGLKNGGLKLDDWVLVIDADIVLPPDARETLERTPLIRNGIHGIDRVHCRGRATWERWRNEIGRGGAWDVRWLREFPIGARIAVRAEIAGSRGAGYVPLGFFQLWNAAQNGIRDYPVDERGTAEGSDILHSLRWPRISRQLIPDLVAIELGADQPTDVGVNWSGRRTPEFSIEEGAYRR